jgi:glycosyltransferase involved in cell wall biosynthesis
MKMVNLILDVRLAQQVGRTSPLARALLGLARQLVQAESVTLLATRGAPLPEGLASMPARVIYALPVLRKPFTLISGGCYANELATNMRPQMRPFVRLLSVSWRRGVGAAAGYVAAGPDLAGISIGRQVNPPVDISELDQLQLGLIEDVPTSLLLVDGVVASNKDVMRNLVAAVRGTDSRIVTLNGASAVEAPEIMDVHLDEGGLRELVSRSSLVVLPAGEPTAVAAWEVEAWGGAWLQIEAGDGIKSLAELREKAIKSGHYAEDDPGAFLAALDALPSQAAPEAPLRPKVALVTPMFPDMGGPPHSSLDLAMALTELCELDIWTNSDMLPLHRRRVHGVYRLSDLFPADRYDEVVYVLGNHQMYVPIYALLRRYGGIVIQHDAHMLDFLNVLLGREGLEKLLKQELGKSYPAHDVGALISSLSDFGRPLLSPVVDVADGVIVHSPTARSIIDELYDGHVEYLPVGMPYSFKLQELSSDKRLSAKYSSGVDPLIPCIISFGEVHLQKGAKQCLFTLSELKSWGISFQFLFVGPVRSDLKSELYEHIQRLDLTDCVKIIGAVSEEQYNRYLVAGDIVLQIRQIPFGQVSGALLDAVSAGMHGVASENLARSIEAPQFVRRVVDGSSPTIYAEQLADLIASKAYEERPGPGWADFTVKHDFGAYARNLLAMIFGPAREGL